MMRIARVPWPQVIIVVAVAAILCATFSPRAWMSGGLDERLSRLSPLLPVGQTSEIDALNNVLLYVPLGFGIALTKAEKDRSAKSITAHALLYSFCLAYVMESIQVPTPGRDASYLDVLANTAGGGWGAIVGRFLVAERYLSLAMIYLMTAMAVAVVLQRTSGFQNWDPRFHLLIGNEQNGERPWSGQIHDVLIANESITPELAASLRNGCPRSPRTEAFAASLLQSGEDGCRLESDENLRLLRRGASGARSAPCGAATDATHWVSEKPAWSLCQNLMETSRFSLALTAAPSKTEQHGPARILTVSKNANERNFTLAQAGSSLVFRLRTPLTGVNGDRPALVVNEVFTDGKPKDLLLTYDGARVRLFVDGHERGESVEFSPGAALASYFVELRTEWMKACRVVFYALIFGPLSLALAYLRRSMPDTRLLFWQILGVALASTVIMEVLLVFASHRPFQPENIAFGGVFLLAPLCLVWPGFRPRTLFR